MNGLTEWKPCRQLKMLPVLGRVFGLKPASATKGAIQSMRSGKRAPSVDLNEDDKEWLVDAHLPETKKVNMKVVVENGVLPLAGGSKFEKKKKDEKHHCREGSYGNFLRSFTRPEGADASKLNAELKDDVLPVHLYQSEKVKALGDEGTQKQRHRYIDRLVKKYTAFESLEDLITAEGIYRPSLYLPSGERWLRHEVNLLADEYNRRQEARGDPRRAFRLRANADLPPPDL